MIFLHSHGWFCRPGHIYHMYDIPEWIWCPCCYTDKDSIPVNGSITCLSPTQQKQSICSCNIWCKTSNKVINKCQYIKLFDNSGISHELWQFWTFKGFYPHRVVKWCLRCVVQHVFSVHRVSFSVMETSPCKKVTVINAHQWLIGLINSL